MTDWAVPTLADVWAARHRIAPHLRPTPLSTNPALDDFILVSDDQIRTAQRTMIEATRNLVEASGAAPLAAALARRDEPARPAGRADRQRRQREPRAAPRRARLSGMGRRRRAAETVAA